MDEPDDTDTTDEDGFDPIADLTVNELNIGSRQLKASLVHAIVQQTQDYADGLALVAWLHARRADPAAKLASFTGMKFGALQTHVSRIGPTPGPTTPGP